MCTSIPGGVAHSPSGSNEEQGWGMRIVMYLARPRRPGHALTRLHSSRPSPELPGRAAGRPLTGAQDPRCVNVPRSRPAGADDVDSGIGQQLEVEPLGSSLNSPARGREPTASFGIRRGSWPSWHWLVMKLPSCGLGSEDSVSAIGFLLDQAEFESFFDACLGGDHFDAGHFANPRP